MSPEQLLGDTIDESWDVWALSVIAYEALSGALPFANAGSDWQRAVITGKFTPVSQHCPNIHVELFRQLEHTEASTR